MKRQAHSSSKNSIKKKKKNITCVVCGELRENPNLRDFRGEIWCERCEQWTHGYCIGLTYKDVTANPDAVWYCRSCLADDPSLKSTFRTVVESVSGVFSRETTVESFVGCSLDPRTSTFDQPGSSNLVPDPSLTSSLSQRDSSFLPSPAHSDMTDLPSCSKPDNHVSNLSSSNLGSSSQNTPNVACSKSLLAGLSAERQQSIHDALGDISDSDDESVESENELASLKQSSVNANKKLPAADSSSVSPGAVESNISKQESVMPVAKKAVVRIQRPPVSNVEPSSVKNNEKFESSPKAVYNKVSKPSMESLCRHERRCDDQMKRSPNNDPKECENIQPKPVGVAERLDAHKDAKIREILGQSARHSLPALSAEKIMEGHNAFIETCLNRNPELNREAIVKWLKSPELQQQAHMFMEIMMKR